MPLAHLAGVACPLSCDIPGSSGHGGVLPAAKPSNLDGSRLSTILPGAGAGPATNAFEKPLRVSPCARSELNGSSRHWGKRARRSRTAFPPAS